MAVKCSMPQFVARCLEEIGLEGRCGMPLRDLFEAMDPENDMAYRRYAWHVLRGMENQLSFHVMRPLEASATGSAEKKPKLEDCATPRRKRKWKTTLLNSPSVDTPAVKTRADDDAERTPKRHKSKNQPLQPVLPSMRRIAAQKQRRRLSESDCEGRDRSDSTSRLRRRRQRSGDGEVMVVEDGENDTVANDETMKKDPDKQGKEQVPAQQQENEAGVSIKEEVEDAADETQWVLRSPRGYRLGEEVDVGGLSYEEAVTSNQDDVLGVVACEQLRLKYLGVEDATLMDTISPQFDLLEIIGRSRLHYLLDMLIGCNYVVKNIVTADQRRFNIVHLRRFASKFHPSMISQSATISRQAFPKEALAQVIVGMMKARGERTCVFADIGRELGYEASTMDIRSVRRIVDELVEEKKMTTMDITLPPKQVLQKAYRKEEQQRKYQANLVDHDNDDYVVVTNRRKQRRTGGGVVKEDHTLEAHTQEVRDQEVVKYSAVLKRKHYQSDVPATEESSQKWRKIARTSNGSISALMTPVDTSEAGVSKFRKQVGAKKSRRTLTWAIEDDLRLIDLYLEQMSCRWFVEVPLALQKKEERVAFRTTNLSRTLISWKELGKVFKKKPVECMLRVNDLLEAPAIQARLERAKVTMTQMKNPGGAFHEEVAIMSQPRLTALLCRALQVILHERSSYYSVLADVLMSNWKESEVKLVWRYLWLAGIITRTPQANEGKNQKQRGFQVHSKVFEMKSLKIPHYLMETFCEAAKYSSFVNENVDEATMVAEENDRYFEHEAEVNMPSGQAAVALSSMVSGFSQLVPFYVTPGKRSAGDPDTQRAVAVKGLAGHLSRQWGGVFPEDFLKEYWTVKSVFGVSDVATQTLNIKAMEAFSGSAQVRQTHRDTRAKRKKHISHNSLASWLSVALTEAASSGVTLNELGEKYAASGLTKTTECNSVIQRELDEMVRKGRVLEVNGYDHSRFILQEFADLWALHPYRITSDSTAEKVHFLFDKDSTVVARPWLHLDGSVNTKMALKLKRKVVNIVMCCPGIKDSAVHKKMRKIVCLQDMRSLLEELLSNGVLYARVFRDCQPPFASIFDLPKSPPSPKADIMSLSPGELRYVDFSRERLHYFPSVNCMELLGAEACDADLG
ncbi:hypothetical protein JG687_00003025 [Phytophthora cactorum]|uniref:B-block binding subunit of TFIIIC domain-containing protein n=1 Tax=Phytophthora cactorum TaxID=29920 RepID=A0A8T1UVB4_9STRA|nr:hypothetical protein JG687_00003025 [Phytophthora cactorum]